MRGLHPVVAAAVVAVAVVVPITFSDASTFSISFDDDVDDRSRRRSREVDRLRCPRGIVLGLDGVNSFLVLYNDFNGIVWCSVVVL